MGKYKITDELSRNGKYKRKKNKEFLKKCNKNQTIASTTTTFDHFNPRHEDFESIPKSLRNDFDSFDTLPLNSQENLDFELKSTTNNPDEIPSLNQSLVSWSLKYNVSRNAVSSLLKILRQEGHDLPNDSRSLLSTPRIIPIQVLEPGEFIYFGLKKQLDYLLKKYVNIPQILYIDCNIDGAPVYKNSYSHGSIWPILCHVVNINSPVFVAGIYGGHSKPNDFNALVKPFIDDYLDIKDTYEFNGSPLKLKLNNTILDLPARSSVCRIIGHCGRNACPFCHVQGTQLKTRYLLLDTEAALRTNLECRAQIDPKHNKNRSEFERISDLDMIQAFPLDYLHCVLLGVVKRLLDIWFGHKGICTPSTKARVSAKIKEFSHYEPKEFNRRLRGLEKMGLWKGTEFRTFLLFLGPSVLCGEISIVQYEQFLILHIAITILVSKEFCIKFNDIAKYLLLEFVQNYSISFGEENYTINTHLLIHLADQCAKNGPLDSFSAFKFENFLGKIKNLVKSPNNPIKQIFNRLSENQINCFNSNSFDINQKIVITLKEPFEKESYKRAFLNDTLIYGESKADSYVQLNNGDIIKVLNFKKVQKMICVEAIKYNNPENIYLLPIESKEINCFKIRTEMYSHLTININQMKRKLFVVPLSAEIIYLYPMNDFSFKKSCNY